MEKKGQLFVSLHSQASTIKFHTCLVVVPGNKVGSLKRFKYNIPYYRHDDSHKANIITAVFGEIWEDDF